MSDTYLIQVAIGPVQGFIASARRSRDLWAGSRLLSNLARSVGQCLLQYQAELIYPTKERLKTPDAAIEQGNLSNQLLAQVNLTEGRSIQELAKALKQTAQTELQSQAQRALDELRQEVPEAQSALDEKLWTQQCQEAMECFVAWVAFDGSDAQYGNALERLKRSMAARKTTRDFAPWAATPDQSDRAGRYKSSLDGLAESVLLPPLNGKKTPVQTLVGRVLSLAPREQLDMLGLVKRFQGRDERFTAFTRIAADPWIEKIKADKSALNNLCAAYEPLIGSEFATRTRGNAGIYSAFPYDASLLYPERLSVALAEAKAARDAGSEKTLEELQNVLKPIWKQHCQPSPYAALIMADGDQMGAFINQALDSRGHNAISAAIARFADEAPGITRTHRGHAVYAGGEDLMLFMPLPGIVGAARALAQRLAECLQEGVAADLLKPGYALPTLRVGAAVCHIMEPYASLRERAQAAEQLAKHGNSGTSPQGNALGLRLHIRSGQTLQTRLRFDDPAAFERLAGWTKAYREGALPGRVAFDTQHFGDQYQRLGIRFEVARSAYQRSLLRANERGGAQSISNALVKELTQSLDASNAALGDGYKALAQLGEELVLARWLSAQTQNDLGERA